MLIRAGASNREMLGALGVDVKRLYTLVFGLGAGARGTGRRHGRADPGGPGRHGRERADPDLRRDRDRRAWAPIKGALVGALLVGMVDTLARALLPDVLRTMMPPSQADGMGASLASMTIYILMAGVLAWKPRGLFPAHA